MLWIIQICTSAFKLELLNNKPTPKMESFIFNRKIFQKPVYIVISCCSDFFFRTVAGLQAFTDFLKSEYSDENIRFWKACEDYRQIACRTEMTCEANRIYSEFVQTEAPSQVCWISVRWGDWQCWVWSGDVVKVPLNERVSCSCLDVYRCINNYIIVWLKC